MRIATILVGLLLATPAWATPLDDFDFWVGSWALTWPQPDGSQGQGVNLISKILDDQVILESFDGRPAMALVGRSFTVYDKNAKRWKQTWVDNQGSYLDFVGGLQNDGSMVLTRKFKKDGKTIHQRMVWFNITQNQFDWHWQRSVDGGENWTTLWPIRYKRVQEPAADATP